VTFPNVSKSKATIFYPVQFLWRASSLFVDGKMIVSLSLSKDDNERDRQENLYSCFHSVFVLCIPLNVGLILLMRMRLVFTRNFAGDNSFLSLISSTVLAYSCYAILSLASTFLLY
jgi:hypothetical protein